MSKKEDVLKFDRDKFAKRRDTQGLSLDGMVRELAKIGVDVSKGKLHNIETGRTETVDLELATAIARVLETDVESLSNRLKIPA